jgi:hypothetical protein
MMKSETMSQHVFSNDYCIEINASRIKVLLYEAHILRKWLFKHCWRHSLKQRVWNILSYASVQMLKLVNCKIHGQNFPSKMAQAERLSLVLGRCPVRHSADKIDHNCFFVGFFSVSGKYLKLSHCHFFCISLNSLFTTIQHLNISRNAGVVK